MLRNNSRSKNQPLQFDITKRRVFDSEMSKISHVLKKELHERQSRNPKYSLRAFARDLNISVTSLSRILADSRMPSDKMLKQFVKKLQIPHLKIKTPSPQGPTRSKKTKFTYISAQKVAPLMGWKFFAILELCLLPNFKADPVWIADKLNLSLEDVQEHVMVLKKEKMLHAQKNGKWKVAHQKMANSQIADLAFTKEQRNALSGLAAAAIRQDSALGKKRVFTLTVGIDPDQLFELEEMINQLIHKATAMFEEGKNRRQVYQVHFNYFPLSKVCE